MSVAEYLLLILSLCSISFASIPQYQPQNQNSPLFTLIQGWQTRCFVLYPNCVLINATPFKGQYPGTPDTCANYCSRYQTGERICEAFVYDKSRRTCDFFNFGGARPTVWRNFFFDYYHLKNECRPIAQSFGYQQSLKTSTEWTTSTLELTTTVSMLPPTTPITIPPRITVCKNNTKPLFLRVEGKSLDSFNTLAIENVDERTCTLFCLENKTPLGVMECQSFSYFNWSRVCVVSSEKAKPVGARDLLNDTSVYLEKICIEGHLLRFCPDSVQVPRIPGRIMVGFNEKVTTVPSFQLCLELCLDSFVNFGFTCKSLMYYGQRGVDNCVLNIFDHIEEPSLFVSMPRETVEYVAITSCLPPTITEELPKFKKQQQSTAFIVRAPMTQYQFRPVWKLRAEAWKRRVQREKSRFYSMG